MARSTNRILPIVAVGLLAGCGDIFGSVLVSADEAAEMEGAPPSRTYDEMKQCFQDVGVDRDGLNVADRQVLYMACGEDMMGPSAASARIGLEEFIYSEVDLDPVYHGVHLILCSMDPKAEKYYHIMEKCRLSWELAPADAFEAGLRGFPGVDDRGVDILVHRHREAAWWLTGESEKWASEPDFNPREAQIFYDVPHQVLASYLHERSENQDLYNQISGFRAHFAYQPFGAGVPADCEVDLLEARATYLSRAVPTPGDAWSLMTTDLGYWITENLVLCHLGRKDWAGALAEALLVKSERREVAVFEKIYTAVAAQILADNEMESKVGQNLAEAKGLVLPYEPTSCSLDCLTVPGRMFASGRPDWERQIGALYPHLEVVRGEISGLAKKGGMVTVQWAPSPPSWETWNCFDTSAVDHVTPDGEVVYRRDCFVEYDDEQDRPPAVTLTAAEAEGLVKGQMATIVVDENDAQSSRVVFACDLGSDGSKTCSRIGKILFQ